MEKRFEFGSVNGYMTTRVWNGAMMLQLFNLQYCRRWLTHNFDPCGRMFDQMTMAARSATANIAEGLSRHQSSRETELKLLDVARATFSELYNDYFFLATSRGIDIWLRNSPEGRQLAALPLNAPDYGNDWPTETQAMLNQQSAIWQPWCASENEAVCLNSLMFLTERIKLMLMSLMATKLESFREEGGFTETMTRERLAAKKEQMVGAEAPKCTDCGSPMVERGIKKGSRQGATFWGCINYPNCRGTRQKTNL